MSFLKKLFSGNSRLQAYPRGNFKGFIETLKDENISGSTEDVETFKKNLAEEYFQKWSDALNNLGIKGYTEEHLANRYKRITDKDFKKCPLEDLAREYEQYAEVVYRNYYLDLDKDSGKSEEFNRSSITKSNYEVKRDFENLKTKVHNSIKEDLIKQNFQAGTFFVDMKDSDVDLLVSLGDLMVGRVPLERFKIDEYIEMRRPEEKSTFDVVKEVLNEPEFKDKVLSKNTKINPLEEALAVEHAKEALVKKMWDMPSHKGEFFNKLWEEFGELVSPAPIRYAMFRSTTWIPNATKEQIEKEDEAYYEKLKRELQEDEDRQDFIRSKYWEIVHRLGLCEELGAEDSACIDIPKYRVEYNKEFRFNAEGKYIPNERMEIRYNATFANQWIEIEEIQGGDPFFTFEVRYYTGEGSGYREYGNSKIQNVFKHLIKEFPDWPQKAIQLILNNFEERYRKYIFENKTVKANSVKVEDGTWVPCKDGEPLVKVKKLEWAIETLPGMIRDIILKDFKWDKPFFSLMDLDFLYNHRGALYADTKESLTSFENRMEGKLQTVRDYLWTLEPTDANELASCNEANEDSHKKYGCGYTMGIGEKGTDKVHIDIMFCEHPGSYPGPAENWKAKEWTNWKKVKELEIPRFLFESLNYYHLDADPNWWFRNSMELEYGRKYSYTNALGTSIFVDTPEMGPKSTDCYQISFRKTAEDDTDFVENKDNALYLKPGKGTGWPVIAEDEEQLLEDMRKYFKPKKDLPSIEALNPPTKEQYEGYEKELNDWVESWMLDHDYKQENGVWKKVK